MRLLDVADRCISAPFPARGSTGAVFGDISYLGFQRIEGRCRWTIVAPARLRWGTSSLCHGQHPDRRTVARMKEADEASLCIRAESRGNQLLAEECMGFRLIEELRMPDLALLFRWRSKRKDAG